MKQVKAFIIPNRCGRIEESTVDCQKDYVCPDGLRPSAEDIAVQLWCHDADCQNLQDYRSGYGNFWCGYVKADALKGITEGTIKNFIINGEEVAITFQQKGYRYERFGNFEEVYQKVI